MGLLQKDAVDTVDTRLIQFRLGHSCALGFYLGTLLPNLVLAVLYPEFLS